MLCGDQDLVVQFSAVAGARDERPNPGNPDGQSPHDCSPLRSASVGSLNSALALGPCSAINSVPGEALCT
jgi:hypothetical protein